FFSSRRRHTIFSRDWSSDVCSSDLTRGHKGAGSRSGYSKKIGFEGGQMPLQRRVPKFCFKNPNRVEYVAINLDSLQDLAERFKQIGRASCRERVESKDVQSG